MKIFCLLLAVTSAYKYESSLGQQNDAESFLARRNLGACAGKITGVSSKWLYTDYSDSKANWGIGTDAFIKNADAAGCPLSKCVLKNNVNKDGAECKKPDPTAVNDLYTGKHFEIAAEAPFQISAIPDAVTGYVEPICVYCLSGEDSGYWAGHAGMHPECDGSFTLKKDREMAVRVSPLADPKAVKVIGDAFDSFFELASESKCLERIECSLLSADCTAAYSGSKLQTIQDPTTKKWPLTTKPGLTEAHWHETLCIKCRVDFNFIHLKNFKVSSSECGEVLVETPKALHQKTVSYADQTQDIANFADFFENKGDPKCTVNQCYLKNLGCATDYTGKNLKIGLVTPFTITADSTLNGFNETLCIECHNINDEQIIHHDFNVVQKHQCAESLSAIVNPPAITKQYHDSKDPQSVLENADQTYFTNKYKADCPVTCSLKDNQCAEKYGKADITLSDKSPFQLAANLNVVAGKTSSFCLQCSNGKQTITKGEISIKQNSKCSNSLSDAKTAPTPPIYKYDTTKKAQEVDTKGWESFFANKYPDTCALNKCEIKKSGCAEAYAGTNLKMAEKAPYAITAKTDDGAKMGYKETVCVSCSTAEQTKTTEFSVQQTSRCLETITGKDEEKNIVIELDAKATEMSTLKMDFAQMFVNADKVNCPITTCSLKQVGCKADYTGTNVKLVKGATGYTAQANTNVEDGYKDQVCISCTNDVQTVNRDGYSVHQKGICDKALVPSTLDVPKEKTDYAEIEDLKNYPQGWEYFFKNDQTVKCPVTTCSLKKGGCKEDFVGDGVVIGAKPDFIIGYKQNVIQGYKEDVCLSCTNGVQTSTRDGLSFQQISKCAVSLKLADAVLPAQTIDHDDTAFTGDITKGWSSFFQNSDDTNCPITSCSILQPGCTEPYTGASLKLKSEAPFNIIQGSTVTAGVAENVCVQCQNKDQKITSDNFSVEQTGACLATLTKNDKPFVVPQLTYGKSVVVAANPVESFLKNNNAEKCPVLKCELKTEGCKEEYKGKEVTMAPTTFAINAPGTIPLGFKTKVCVSCNTENEWITHDSIELKQDSTCLSSLKNNRLYQGNLLRYPYDNSRLQSDKGKIFQVFFENADETNCPVTKCELMAQGCEQPYTPGRLSMKNIGGEWHLLHRSVEAGYKETVCFKCSNKEASITQDNHVIVQEALPGDAMLYVFVFIGGLFLAIIIIVLGCCYKKHLEDMENIKWRRKQMEARLEQIEKAPKKSRRNTMIVNPKGKDFDDLRAIQNPEESGQDKAKHERKKRHSMFVKSGAPGAGAGAGAARAQHTPTMVGKDLLSGGSDGGANLVGRGTEVTQNINLSPIVGSNDNSGRALINQQQNTNEDEAATNYGRPPQQFNQGRQTGADDATNYGGQNNQGGYAYEPSELDSVTHSVAGGGQDIDYGGGDARKVDFNDPAAAKRRAQGKRKTAMPQQASFKGQRPAAMGLDPNQKRKTAATFQMQRDINQLDSEIRQVQPDGLQMVNVESQQQENPDQYRDELFSFDPQQPQMGSQVVQYQNVPNDSIEEPMQRKSIDVAAQSDNNFRGTAAFGSKSEFNQKRDKSKSVMIANPTVSKSTIGGMGVSLVDKMKKLQNNRHKSIIISSPLRLHSAVSMDDSGDDAKVKSPHGRQ